jgi:Flp pilus assembly protein TadD
MTGPHSASLTALVRAAASAVDAGDDARAEPLFLQIVGLNPRDAEAWHMLAIVAIRAGRAAEASERAQRAHQLQRRNHHYLNTLGIAYGEAQRLEEAVRCFRRALKERPDYADGHYNLGKALGKLEQFAEAEAAYRRALHLAPGRVDVANNLGTLYCRMRRFDEALPLLERSSAAAPDDEAIAGNLALALFGARDAQAAGRHMASFVERHPDSPLRGNFALNLLSRGRFEEGWREYTYTPRTPTAVPPSRLVDRLPEPLHERDVLLIPEQGIGDHLFFLRFVPLLRQRGARVGFVASTKLFEMLKGNPGLDCVIKNGEDIPVAYAGAVPVLMGNLPGMLGCPDAPGPFRIVVEQERVETWRRKLAQLGPPPYLAVTWRAGRKREPQPEFLQEGSVPLYKEIAIDTLARAVKSWHGTVLVIQRAPTSEESAAFLRALGRAAHDLSALNGALEEMAALLCVVDEYVGVSNTNMHIRAGIGKTARVLVPFPPEFRWMHAGERSPWFPGFTIYRQQVPRDWTAALKKLSEDLSH